MKLKTLTVSEATKLLKQHGFEFTSQKGSHRKFENGSITIGIICHCSPKETLSPGLNKKLLAAIEKSKLKK